MYKLFFTIIFIGSLNACYLTEENVDWYVEQILSANKATLPDGKDLDGNITTTGRLLCVHPRDRNEIYKEKANMLIKNVLKIKDEFFAEPDTTARKFELREQIAKNYVAGAILGDFHCWLSLCSMMHSSIYIAKIQPSREAYFHQQANIYLNPALLDESIGFLGFFKQIFSSNHPVSEYRKIQ